MRVGRFALALAASMTLAGALVRPLVDHRPGGGAGLAAGLGFTFASLVLGLVAIRWGVARGPRHFLAAIFGGVTARFVALFAFALVLAFATSADVVVGLLTVIAAHFVFGGIEIAYLMRTGALK